MPEICNGAAQKFCEVVADGLDHLLALWVRQPAVVLRQVRQVTTWCLQVTSKIRPPTGEICASSMDRCTLLCTLDGANLMLPDTVFHIDHSDFANRLNILSRSSSNDCTALPAAASICAVRHCLRVSISHYRAICMCCPCELWLDKAW